MLDRAVESTWPESDSSRRQGEDGWLGGGELVSTEVIKGYALIDCSQCHTRGSLDLELLRCGGH